MYSLNIIIYTTTVPVKFENQNKQIRLKNITLLFGRTAHRWRRRRVWPGDRRVGHMRHRGRWCQPSAAFLASDGSKLRRIDGDRDQFSPNRGGDRQKRARPVYSGDGERRRGRPEGGGGTGVGASGYWGRRWQHRRVGRREVFSKVASEE